MKHFVVGIDWYGPYRSTTEHSARQVTAQAAATPEYPAAGLYCAVGPLRDGLGSGPVYVGLSIDLGQRLRNHKGLEIVEREIGVEEMWLGYAATAEQGGRRDRAAPRTIDDAEWCHIYFMQPRGNEQRRGAPPAQPVTVLNHWWHVDGRPRERRPYRTWPDLIEYMGAEQRSRVVWFGGRVETHRLHERDLTLD